MFSSWPIWLANSQTAQSLKVLCLTVATILCSQLIADKPKGLWLKRIGAEYKKAYGDELSSEKLERLKTLPDIARCEE